MGHDVRKQWGFIIDEATKVDVMLHFTYEVDGLIHWIPYLGTLEMIKAPVFEPPLPRVQQACLVQAIMTHRSILVTVCL